eukprot:352421-Chlamydomonas_euryale.AAC.96
MQPSFPRPVPKRHTRRHEQLDIAVSIAAQWSPCKLALVKSMWDRAEPLLPETAAASTFTSFAVMSRLSPRFSDVKQVLLPRASASAQAAVAPAALQLTSSSFKLACVDMAGAS